MLGRAHVVGQGAEGAKCLDVWAALGCDAARGYHVGKPVPSADLPALARRLDAPAPAASLVA